MFRVSSIVLGSFMAAALPFSPQPVAGSAAVYPTFPLSELQQDYDQFRTIVITQHPRLYADRTELDSALVVQRALLRHGMSELDFLRVLAPLVRRLNCGHTHIDLSAATQTATSAQRRLLPFAIRIVDGRLYIAKTLAADTSLLGLELLSINGRTANNVIQQLYDNLTSDGTNVTFKRYRLSHGFEFSSSYHLFVDSAETFAITYRDPLRREAATAMVDGVAAADLGPLRDNSTTLVDGIGWSEFTDDHALLAVKTFNFYDTAGHTRFYGFIERFFDEVAARHSPHVILDLRGNGGGDPYCGSYLVAHLLTDPEPYFAANTPSYPDLKAPMAVSPNAYHGPVYILADGGCFSTTGHVCSLLRYHGLGLFIGEETGGSAVCTAATQTAVLTHTQLQFQYSTLAFGTATSGLMTGRGIMPTYEVIPTIEDELAERDAAKEFAVSLFRYTDPRPAIVSAPQPHAIAAGETVVLAVETRGCALRYQWLREGAAIDGATSHLLVLPAFPSAASGNYTVTVANPLGSVTTEPVAVTVRPGTRAAALINISVLTATGSGDQALSVGFALGREVTPGGRTRVLARAVGPQLRAFGVPNLLADPRIRLVDQATSATLAANEDWKGDAVLRDTAAAVGAFPLDPDERDAAMVCTLPVGLYSVQVSGPASGTVLAEVYDATSGDDPAGGPRLMNVSARAPIDEQSPLAAGFVLNGSTDTTVLLRGIGPGLQSFVGNAAASDPKLSVFRHENGQSVRIFGDDDWGGNPQIAALARGTGAFALSAPGSKDAACVLTLPPGLYSVRVDAVPDSGGIALVEVYVVH